MKVRATYKPDAQFLGAYKLDYRDAVLLGSRGSGKTWNVSNIVSSLMYRWTDKRTLIMRDVASQVKQSILHEIKKHFAKIIKKSNGSLQHLYDIQEYTIKRTFQNEESTFDYDAVFTKGFRTSRSDQEDDLKGLEDVDYAILEELKDVRDESRINTLRATLRKTGRKLFMMSNSVDSEHWIAKRYFHLEESKEFPDFLVPIPKKIDGVYVSLTTYLNNPHLDAETRKEYDSYNDPNSYLYDPYTYAKDYLCLFEKVGTGSYFKINDIKMSNLSGVYVEDLIVYQAPIAGHVYAIGVDNSSGQGADAGSLDVLDVTTGLQAATATCMMEEHEWAYFITKVGRMYNNAYLAIERNEAGRVVIRIAVEDYHYPTELMYRQKSDDDGGNNPSVQRRLGFSTTSSSRPPMLAELKNALRTKKIIVSDMTTLSQCKTFEVIDGKPQAKSGFNDDKVISLGIAYVCLNYVKKRTITI